MGQEAAHRQGASSTGQPPAARYRPPPAARYRPSPTTYRPQPPAAQDCALATYRPHAVSIYRSTAGKAKGASEVIELLDSDSDSSDAEANAEAGPPGLRSGDDGEADSLALARRLQADESGGQGRIGGQAGGLAGWLMGDEAMAARLQEEEVQMQVCRCYCDEHNILSFFLKHR